VITRDTDVKAEVKTEAEELTGKLSKQEENKLMNSVLENDKEIIEEGKLIKDAINQGMSAFTPDLIMEQLVKNFSVAKKLFGETLLRQLTGYDASYIERNINIPEFQKELGYKINENIRKLKDSKFLKKDGSITDKGIELASLILYTEELDNIIPKGILGEKIHKKSFIYGDKDNIKEYKKGDRYRDIAIKRSAKLAIRRKHKKLKKVDLKTFERQSKGSIEIIYALDASGSMKGKKIDVCKKAGIALAYKALEEKDKVGLIVFGSDIRTEIKPTDDFKRLLLDITKIKASKETNIAKTISRAVELFPNKEITKHLILLTDAMPTVGIKPEEETLEAVSTAKSNGITISLVGIKLEGKSKKLAEKIASLGEGKLYIVRDLEQLDKIVLEDYYGVI